MSSSSYLIPALIALPFFALPYLTKTPPTREQIIRPQDEHVLILGGSDGCGKGLAEDYAIKRGARVMIVARTLDNLVTVQNNIKSRLQKELKLSAEEAAGRILVQAGDISNPKDLINIRDKVVQEWGKLDTLHIISGLSSTETIYNSLGMEMVPIDGSESKRNHRTHKFESVDSSGAQDETQLPSLEAMLKLEEDTKRLNSVNTDGVIYSVGCFLPLLSSTSKSPLIQHLSSVAAIIPAPTRMLYSATKAGGLAAFKTCAAECARQQGGAGVRFLAVCPGTIDTAFRRKSFGAQKAQAGLKLELEGTESGVGKVLTVQETVDAIMHHASLPPTYTPLVFRLPIPFLGELLKIQIPFISIPPEDIVVLPPWPYKLAWWLDATWLRGRMEFMGRKKYGLE